MADSRKPARAVKSKETQRRSDILDRSVEQTSDGSSDRSSERSAEHKKEFEKTISPYKLPDLLSVAERKDYSAVLSILKTNIDLCPEVGMAMRFEFFATWMKLMSIPELKDIFKSYIQCQIMLHRISPLNKLPVDAGLLLKEVTDVKQIHTALKNGMSDEVKRAGLSLGSIQESLNEYDSGKYFHELLGPVINQLIDNMCNKHEIAYLESATLVAFCKAHGITADDLSNKFYYHHVRTMGMEMEAPESRTLFSTAIRFRKVELVKACLELGVNANFVPKKTSEYQNLPIQHPLYEVILTDTPMLELLLSHGATLPVELPVIHYYTKTTEKEPEKYLLLLKDKIEAARKSLSKAAVTKPAETKVVEMKIADTPKLTSQTLFIPEKKLNFQKDIAVFTDDYQAVRVRATLGNLIKFHSKLVGSISVTVNKTTGKLEISSDREEKEFSKLFTGSPEPKPVNGRNTITCDLVQGVKYLRSVLDANQFLVAEFRKYPPLNGQDIVEHLLMIGLEEAVYKKIGEASPKPYFDDKGQFIYTSKVKTFGKIVGLGSLVNVATKAGAVIPAELLLEVTNIGNEKLNKLKPTKR